MDLEKIRHRALFSWVPMAVLVCVVCTLAVLQYRWIGELNEAERKKLQESLHAQLNEISRDFNAELNTACAALIPTEQQVQDEGRERAYGARYVQWKESAPHPQLFSRLGIAYNESGRVVIRILDLATAKYEPAQWPESWGPLREFIQRRIENGSQGSPRAAIDRTDLIDCPRFQDQSGQDPNARPVEKEWLVAEIDRARVSNVILPDLLNRYLGSDYESQYRAEVAQRLNPSEIVYRSDSGASPVNDTDLTVTTFDVPAGRGGRKDTGRGRWLLSITPRSGSLDSVIASTRHKNIAVSSALLLLLLATGTALVRFSRRTQRLAEMEMEFVAGVSHELRTPLTVIRTAAFNLRGKMAANPAQVERYGTLIQQESEKLAGIVEQVLQFSSANAGRVLHENAPIDVQALIDRTVQSSKGALEEGLCQIEKHVDPVLPKVEGDERALQQALQNLITNAAKYGGPSGWIGIFAQAKDRSVEIRVSDHGPGIPPEEQEYIFDAFFRGKNAIRDQIHGTGLGLNLVKKIIEAHHGTVAVESTPDRGTSFILTLPRVSGGLAA